MYNPTTPGYNTQNQTRFTPNYEPTISDNPYASSPYDLQKIPTPPPPPRQGNKGLLVALVSVSCLVLLIAGAFFAVAYFSSKPGNTPIAHSTVQPYNAMSIIRDFQAHGLPLDHLQYGMTINQFVGSSYSTVITIQSSAEFIDPSFCTGPCDSGSVWLGIYNSPVDAQSEYNGLASYRISLEQNGPGPGALSSMVQSGHCLLIGEPATSEYAAILRSSCT